MIKRSKVRKYQQQAAEMLQQAGVAITDKERAEIEVVDNGLSEVERTGLLVVTYVNTDR